jgi:hypothetical protein
MRGGTKLVNREGASERDTRVIGMCLLSQ